MSRVIEQRREYTDNRLEDLKQKLGDTDADAVTRDKACVYITGSGGRGELSSHSDLDLFIVSDVEAPKDRRPPGEAAKPKLRRLDGIVVKAALIQAAKDLRFPEFSKDGKYLETYTTEDLCENLGRSEDDHANTFTARLLLLLESRPLLGEDVYRQVIDEVIDPYWRDYEDRKDTFRPVFLINDIVRLWKTLCVNYEANTERHPDQKRAKRKLTNYKLKHSRVLTCYSAVLYLMQVFSDEATVHPAHVRDMVKRSPTERLEWIASQTTFRHQQDISRILERYEKFLASTDQSERALVSLFLDAEKAKQFTQSTPSVGDAIAELLQKLAGNNPLYRYLIV